MNDPKLEQMNLKVIVISKQHEFLNYYHIIYLSIYLSICLSIYTTTIEATEKIINK